MRGAAAQSAEYPGLATSEIGDRLLTHAPDLTRLLDRMSMQGLVTRCRATSDRRVVTTHLTDKGYALLAELDAPLSDLHLRQFAGLGPAQLQTLLVLLEAVQMPLT